MKFRIAIPARYASTRLPGKPLRLIAGDPLIVHTVRRALACAPDQVIVATDHAGIADAVAGLPVTVAMTPADLATGSDRLAWCARELGWADDDAVINLQGDSLVPKAAIARVLETLRTDSAPVATLATPVREAGEAFNPNVVKVVRDGRGRALIFLRAPIPWQRDAFAADRPPAGRCRPAAPPGLYGYRAGFLRTFPDLPASALGRPRPWSSCASWPQAMPSPSPWSTNLPGVDSEGIAAVEARLANMENTWK